MLDFFLTLCRFHAKWEDTLLLRVETFENIIQDSFTSRLCFYTRTASAAKGCKREQAPVNGIYFSLLILFFILSFSRLSSLGSHLSFFVRSERLTLPRRQRPMNDRRKSQAIWVHVAYYQSPRRVTNWFFGGSCGLGHHVLTILILYIFINQTYYWF